jgi:hypothetical protein
MRRRTLAGEPLANLAGPRLLDDDGGPMTESRRSRLLYVALTLFALAAPGCGNGANRRPAEKAEAAVEAFLEAWSQGETPEKFAGTHQSISVSDPDWTAGYHLLSYLSVETKQSSEAPSRFRCRVALSLRYPKGKTVEKEVVYEIVSGEKYVISRGQR